MVNWKSLVKRIPSKVQITRKVFYEVVYTDTIISGDDVLGETRLETKQIALKLGQAPRELVHTWIHELFHAISEEYDVGLTETQVRKLEKAAYYFLKRGNFFK